MEFGANDVNGAVRLIGAQVMQTDGTGDQIGNLKTC
jgi:hypothetical protein